jgi:GDP-L-fucose synthase
MINKESKILIAGAKGMVGSAIVNRLNELNYTNIICPSKKDINFLDQFKTAKYLNENNFEYIFIAAAKVGGIMANNTYRADFIYENLMIACNLIHSAHENNINDLCFLGSSCIYPRESKQPIREEYLLSGPLEKTNEPYAIAKIAGIKLCESYNSQYGRNYKCIMPTNLYGPNDSYDLNNSHVLPALIKKIHDAKINKSSKIELWGSGEPLREFLFVEDLADACVFLMNKKFNETIINVGYGKDISIINLAYQIMDVVGYKCDISTDQKKPNGTMRKVLDISKIIHLGWNPKTSLKDGLKKTYENYLEKHN